jgi:CheY-like chemotaxis protein
MIRGEKMFLLVEDDPYDVVFVEEEFRRARGVARLRVVNDGVDAMHYVSGQGDYADRRKYPKPDVILLDLRMPRWDGFEFLEWLRSESPRRDRSVPVMVLSASSIPEHIARAYALGANACLAKPFAWDEFQQHLAALGISWSALVATTATDPSRTHE